MGCFPQMHRGISVRLGSPGLEMNFLRRPTIWRASAGVNRRDISDFIGEELQRGFRDRDGNRAIVDRHPLPAKYACCTAPVSVLPRSPAACKSAAHPTAVFRDSLCLRGHLVWPPYLAAARSTLRDLGVSCLYGCFSKPLAVV